MKTLQQLISVLGLLISPVLIFAQINIKATIYDANKELVPVANAIIHDHENNMVFGDIIYDGTLDLQWDFIPNHTLTISALGWNDLKINLTDCASGCDLGKLTFEQSTIDLAEVVVTERIRLFEAKEGIIQVNVENTILSEKESAIEVLKSSPGIFVRGEDDINIFGKGTAKIYIDGVEVQNSEVLKSLSANEIKKMEIIRNPSAKYDASGRAVINIQTKNSALEGILGQVQMKLSKATYQSGQIVSNLSINKNKYSFYIAANWSPFKKLYEEDYNRLISTDAGTNTLNNRIQSPNKAWLNNAYRTKFDYKFSDNQRASIEWKGKIFDGNTERINTNNVTEANETPFTITSITDGNRKYNYNIVTGQYSWNLTEKQKLNIVASQTVLNLDRISFIDESTGLGNNINSRSNGNSHYQIFIGKLDYEQPVFGDFKLELGTKVSMTQNEGKNTLSRENKGEYVEIPEFGTDYQYDEQNYAAYSTLKRSWGNWFAQVGLRYEHTLATGSKTEAGKFVDRIYSNLFPSATMTYKLSEHIGTALNYSKRIKRPSFSDLDPTIDYLDAFSTLRGNPELTPEFTDSYELNFSYDDYPILNIGYSSSKDPINLIVEKDAENELINVGITRNLDYLKVFSTDITIPYRSNWWTSINSFGFSRQFLEYNENFNNGEVLTNNDWYIYTRQDFKVGNGWNLGTSFLWYSPGLDGIFRYRSAHNWDIWISKKLAGGKWNVSLQANDLLKSNFQGGETHIENISLSTLSYNDNRKVTLTITHKFGNLKKTTGGKSKNSSEFNRIDLN